MDSDEGLQSWLNDKTCRRVWLGYSKEDWYNLTRLEGKLFITVVKTMSQIDG